ncbi:hypothetical protein F4781DRAFT_416101 [Annulohypoxylon bovei var. microspora]|nr:hypothetical protein F4781DRAFT_416101 [Annulohypoxylon bovei var. microspora]
MRLSIVAVFAAGLASATALFLSPDKYSTQRKIGKIIPVSKVQCTHDDIEPRYVTKARLRLAKWGLRNKIPPKCLKKAIVETVVWYVCNCKYTYRDPVPLEELLDVEEILENECGTYRSGWVWSKKWDKMYEVQNVRWIENMTTPYEYCPNHCAFNDVDSGPDDGPFTYASNSTTTIEREARRGLIEI